MRKRFAFIFVVGAVTQGIFAMDPAEEMKPESEMVLLRHCADVVDVFIVPQKYDYGIKMEKPPSEKLWRALLDQCKQEDKMISALEHTPSADTAPSADTTPSADTASSADTAPAARIERFPAAHISWCTRNGVSPRVQLSAPTNEVLMIDLKDALASQTWNGFFDKIMSHVWGFDPQESDAPMTVVLNLTNPRYLPSFAMPQVSGIVFYGHISDDAQVDFFNAPNLTWFKMSDCGVARLPLFLYHIPSVWKRGDFELVCRGTTDLVCAHQDLMHLFGQEDLGAGDHSAASWGIRKGVMLGLAHASPDYGWEALRAIHERFKIHKGYPIGRFMGRENPWNIDAKDLKPFRFNVRQDSFGVFFSTHGDVREVEAFSITKIPCSTQVGGINHGRSMGSVSYEDFFLDKNFQGGLTTNLSGEQSASSKYFEDYRKLKVINKDLCIATQVKCALAIFKSDSEYPHFVKMHVGLTSDPLSIVCGPYFVNLSQIDCETDELVVGKVRDLLILDVVELLRCHLRLLRK